MAKLTIEIDTGVLEKVNNSQARADIGRAQDVRTIQNLTEILQEATSRLEKMGRNANGVKLYNRQREVGTIVLEESERQSKNTPAWVQREGCRQALCVCHDPAVAARRPFCSHCGCRDPEAPDTKTPADVKIFKKGDPNHCVNWFWENTKTNTISGPFASAQDAIDHARKFE